ncbi:MAG: hypothetical protein O7G84_01030 [Gammaproteobacteria bacterium]|nr:hypothetical protein [Gammaproteobacteria bacterium]
MKKYDAEVVGLIAERVHARTARLNGTDGLVGCTDFVPRLDKTMKRQPRTVRLAVNPDEMVLIGEHMASREDPQCARIEIRTDKKTKDALQALAEEAGADSLTAFMLDRAIARPTQKEIREWRKRSNSKVAVAKRGVRDAQKKLREAQGNG